RSRSVVEPDEGAADVEALVAELGVGGEATIPVLLAVAVGVAAHADGHLRERVAGEIAFPLCAFRQTKHVQLQAGRVLQRLVWIVRHVRALTVEHADRILEHRQNRLRAGVPYKAAHRDTDVARGEVLELLTRLREWGVDGAVEERDVHLVELEGLE